MAGKLYGIGVGPGDPELMTLKAIRTIRACDLILVPGDYYKSSVAYRIAVQVVPEMADKEIHTISMPMTRDEDTLREYHRNAAQHVMMWLDQGMTVGILNIGDITIYSTYMYIHKLVKAAGYETELINGVPSFCTAAARLNTGLAESRQQIHVIPECNQVEEALKLPGTKVIMKMGSSMAELKQTLKDAGVEAMMVENCGMPDEKVYHSTEELDEDAGYFSLVIVKEKE